MQEHFAAAVARMGRFLVENERLLVVAASTMIMSLSHTALRPVLPVFAKVSHSTCTIYSRTSCMVREYGQQGQVASCISGLSLMAILACHGLKHPAVQCTFDQWPGRGLMCTGAQMLRFHEWSSSAAPCRDLEWARQQWEQPSRCTPWPA